MSDVVRVALCDDHGVVRSGLRRILEAENDLEVVGEAAHHAALADPSLADGEAGPEIAKAYRMRNVIAHGYQIIEPKTIWDTATLSIPQFADVVQRVLTARKARSP